MKSRFGYTLGDTEYLSGLPGHRSGFGIRESIASLAGVSRLRASRAILTCSLDAPTVPSMRSRSTIQATYDDPTEYEPMIDAAIQRVADEVAKILQPPSENVVPLRR